MENIKAKAWEFLVKCNINKLPIDTIEFNNLNAGFGIVSYSDSIEYIQSLGLTEYAKTHLAFTAFNTERKTPIIFFSDSLSYSERNFIIAHEIGHIVLGHTVYEKIIGKCPNQDEENMQEKEADVFAYAFLAPVPVLLKTKAFSPVAISRKTGLPLDICNSIALEVINESKIPKGDIEKRLLICFRDYIKDCGCQNFWRYVKRPAVLIILSVVIIAAVTIAVKIFSGSIKSQKASISVNSLRALTPAADCSISKNSYPETELKVYITPSGQKYHVSGCRHIDGKDIMELSIDEAEKLGYTPCLDCIHEE
ncbi:ImmA/IrrE family metallo-endopeptidase [Lachnospiraceae bacterium NSJ-143]|nr:ImmA/IrrE family metallo-endopeptidase [Lachnospiraceae bacterium NSJ-143]